MKKYFEMKTKLPILFALFVFLFWNCSSDDDNVSSTEDPIVNYFPLVVSNTWQYNNSQTNAAETTTSQEDLTVESEQQVNNQTRFSLSTTADATGVSFTNILSSGEVYKEETKMLITGNFGFGLGEGETDLPGLDVDFEDLVLYDSEAVTGNVLFTQDQNFDLPEFNGITLSVTLTIQSISLGSDEQLEVDGVVYQDIIGSQFIVSMGIDATTILPPLPVPVTLPAINFQEVVNSTNYFANEIGLVQSETDLSVTFSDLIAQIPGFDLENIQILIEQKIADYQVTLED